MERNFDNITAYLLFLFIISLFGILICQFPMAYIWATYEDLIGEWTQFYFFAIAFFFSACLAVSRSRFRLFFAVLALTCLYVTGEEISWGQRIFGYATPDFFSQNNLQQETNLHNFFTGPYSTSLKKIIEIGLAFSLILYGVVYPQELSTEWKPVMWLRDKGIPAPPHYLWPFFATGALFELGLFDFNEAEIAEILISLAVAIFSYHYWCTDKKHNTKIFTSKSLAAGIILIFSTGAGLGAATTFGSYHNQKMKVGMDKRINSGISKFAARYARYERWENSIELYEKLLAQNPKNTHTLRNFADVYKRVGQEKLFVELNRKALYIDMARYGRNPSSTAVNLSLYETFLQADNKEKADFHLQKALESSREKVMLDPQNDWAAYELGKSYLVAGKIPEALEQIKKAILLKPQSKTYQKALDRAMIQSQYLRSS